MVLLAAASVTVILLLGGLLLSIGLRQILIDNTVDIGRLRAQDLATLAADGALPDSVAITGEEEALVQVVVGGRVVAASTNVQGEAALPVPAPPPGSELVRHGGELPIGDGDVRLVSLGMTTPQGPGVVHVAVAIGDIADTVGTAVNVGLAGLPVLILLMSGVMWVVVGRTLAPIEAIRREADAIEGDRLERRVPDAGSRDEVGRLGRTVNRMLDRIQASSERQRRFVGDAAHELRSPIASLRTQLETARSARRAVDWDEVSAGLLDETLRMQRLTEQLLLLARLDDASFAADRVAVDLDDVIEQAAADQRRVRPGTAIDIGGVLPVQVMGQPTLLGQLVRNLLDNATRHAAARVEVRLTRMDGVAVLEIDDDGPGVPVERREDLFGRFRRLDDARGRDEGGAGLGLALVADIVRVHGGNVEIAEAALGGARLTVRLFQEAPAAG